MLLKSLILASLCLPTILSGGDDKPDRLPETFGSRWTINPEQGAPLLGFGIPESVWIEPRLAIPMMLCNVNPMVLDSRSPFGQVPINLGALNALAGEANDAGVEPETVSRRLLIQRARGLFEGEGDDWVDYPRSGIEANADGFTFTSPLSISNQIKGLSKVVLSPSRRNRFIKQLVFLDAQTPRVDFRIAKSWLANRMSAEEMSLACVVYASQAEDGAIKFYSAGSEEDGDKIAVEVWAGIGKLSYQVRSDWSWLFNAEGLTYEVLPEDRSWTVLSLSYTPDSSRKTFYQFDHEARLTQAIEVDNRYVRRYLLDTSFDEFGGATGLIDVGGRKEHDFQAMPTADAHSIAALEQLTWDQHNPARSLATYHSGQLTGLALLRDEAWRAQLFSSRSQQGVVEYASRDREPRARLYVE